MSSAVCLDGTRNVFPRRTHTEEVAMDMNEALARLEIQDVLWTYARGVDRADYEAMSSVYHPDGTDDHGSFSGLGTDFARQVTDHGKERIMVGQHHITNMIIQMEGENDALVESYFLAFHPHADDGPEKMGIAAGRYLDHFQRRDGRWKILSREVVMDWTRNHVDDGPWERADGRPQQGARQTTGDRSYSFFARKARTP